jgi:hypothetical protein
VGKTMPAMVTTTRLFCGFVSFETMHRFSIPSTW